MSTAIREFFLEGTLPSARQRYQLMWPGKIATKSMTYTPPRIDAYSEA